MDEHGNDPSVPDPDDAELAAVADRLRALASAPLDDGLAARCAARMDDARRRSRRMRMRVVPVAAALAFLASGAGLAAADSLPGPAQDVAHRALGAVGIDVPPGHDRYDDPVECPGGPYRNHGAYVRSHKDDPDAGRSPCGKPVRAVEHPDAGTDDADDGRGPPPWANGRGHDEDEPAGDDVPEDGEEPDDGGAVTPAPTTGTSATTTTASTSTTTSTAPATTTVPDPTTTTTT
jgi:hypothetical protein